MSGSVSELLSRVIRSFASALMLSALGIAELNGSGQDGLWRPYRISFTRPPSQLMAFVVACVLARSWRNPRR
jgi:hypothetical protein